jgi:hypothetical protein
MLHSEFTPDEEEITFNLNLARRYEKSTLTNKIRLKGRDEQELQYMFPSLYGYKAVTKNTKGIMKQFHKKVTKKTYIPYL